MATPDEMIIAQIARIETELKKLKEMLTVKKMEEDSAGNERKSETDEKQTKIPDNDWGAVKTKLTAMLAADLTTRPGWFMGKINKPLERHLTSTRRSLALAAANEPRPGWETSLPLLFT